MKFPQFSLLSIAIASALGSSASVLAADAPALEEIVVTAQKRTQKLEDVPISLSAINGQKLEEAGITSIAGIADYTPSFNMTQTGIGTNIAIRGISSGVNQGFEQSAAMFIDGIHYGRSQLARAPFLDIERIEVLRGPQSILFGKNSTAGAISIITAKPTDTFEGSVTALYEPEYGEKDGRLVVSGPLTDTLSGRLAIMERRYDGFIENTTLNRDEAAEKDQVVRATLSWKPSDTWNFTLKGEKGSFDNDGRNIEVVNPIFKTDSNGNPVAGAVPYANVLGFLTAGAYVLDTTEDGKRQSNGDYSYNDTKNVTFTVEHDIDDMTFTSVTGYNAYKYDELCDCDFTGASGFNIHSLEDYDQVSQEFRLASSEKQTVSWLTGVFYQGSDLKFHDTVLVPTDSFIATAFASPSLFGALGNLLRGASTQRDFKQETDLKAVFGQLTWNITDSTRVLLGARYTQETKDDSRHQYHVDAQGNLVTSMDPKNSYNVLWKQFRIDPHQISGDRDESGFTPQIIFQQDLNSTDRLYASYTTGFKSGGFDVRANSAPTALGGIYAGADTDGSWEFADEKVKNYEVGGKFALANGAAELNVAVFRSEFTNMQTSQFDGSLSFNVTNAGEAVVQGIELDGRWAITDGLLMRGGLSYIDFEYTKFPNSQCYFGQVDNIGAVGDGVCDATGLRREFVPEWQGNVGWDYKYYFDGGLKLTTTLDLIYSDKYLTTPSLDPRFVQDAYTKVNARIALSGNDGKWELALIGKNLTDQSVITYANGLPVASVLTKGTSSGYYAFYDQPRSVAVQGILHF